MHHAFSLIFYIQHLWPGGNFAPFEEVKVPVSNSADIFFSKKVPLGGFCMIWGVYSIVILNIKTQILISKFCVAFFCYAIQEKSITHPSTLVIVRAHSQPCPQDFRGSFCILCSLIPEILSHTINPNHLKPFKLQQQDLFDFDGLCYGIAQTGILYMGAGCPNSSQVVVLLHGVVFWWTQYCIAQTGILCMGTGVPIPSKSNSWVVVFVHGVGFWRIEEGS